MAEKTAAVTDEQIQNWFTYHPATPEQQVKYKEIRDGALAYAKVLRDNTPPGPEQEMAIRHHLRLCVMISNAAIACDGQ